MRKPFLLPVMPFLSMVLLVSPGVVGTATDFEEIHHDGDLVIEGDQTYVIEDKEFFIEGNIFVRDNAKLVISNSNIILEATYTNQYEISVWDRGILEIENSTLDYPDRENLMSKGQELMLYIFTGHPATKLQICDTTSYLGILLGGDAIIESSYINGDGVMWRCYGGPNSLLMTDTTTRFITLSFMGNEIEEIRLSKLEFPFVDKVHIVTMSGANVDLENCYLEQGWIIDAAEYDRESYNVNGMRNRQNLIIEDSDIERLWFWFGSDADVIIKELHPMEVTQWNMHDSIGGSGFEYDVTVRNSSIKWYQLTFRGNAELDNISGSEITLQEQTSVSISNSQLEQYVNMTGTNDRLKITDTVMTKTSRLQLRQGLGPWEAPPGGFNHYLEFHKTIIDAPIVIACQYVSIKGEVQFNTKLDRVRWPFGIIDREYSVIVRDRSNNPIPGEPFQLLDPDNKVIWNGITDEKGEISPGITITFNKDNYTQEWKLVSSNAGFFKRIGLLTSTPVIIYPGARDLVVQLVGLNWVLIVIAVVVIAVSAIIILLVLRKKTKVE